MTDHAECANITVLHDMNAERKAHDSQRVTTQQVDGGNTIHLQIIFQRQNRSMQCKFNIM